MYLFTNQYPVAKYTINNIVFDQKYFKKKIKKTLDKSAIIVYNLICKELQERFKKLLRSMVVMVTLASVLFKMGLSPRYIHFKYAEDEKSAFIFYNDVLVGQWSFKDIDWIT